MNQKNVLFIGAHPDDELYTAGTLKLLQEKGFSLHGISFTYGENGSVMRGGISVKLSSDETREIRKKEFTQAHQFFGFVSSECYEQQDGDIRQSNELRWRLVGRIRELKPVLIITHSDTDSHPDHIAVANIVLDAIQYSAISVNSDKLGKPFRVPVFWKVEGYHPENDAFYVDVSAYKTFKVELMKKYQSQLSKGVVRCTEVSDARNGLAVKVSEAEGFVQDPRWPSLISAIL